MGIHFTSMNSETYHTLLTREYAYGLTVTIHRPDRRNSLNAVLLDELNRVLDQALQNSAWKFIVIQGENGVFCTGMDFEEVASSEFSEDAMRYHASQYMNLIRRLTLIPKFVISNVDGQVIGGGVGIAAASDWVIASPKSQFSLSEALWGLLPAMVIPYLIRRIGYRKAYQMTLTTLPVSAPEAREINLADEVSDSSEDSIKKLWLRLRRVDDSTIGTIKAYFKKMGFITEQIEKTAVTEITRLMTDPKVKRNIDQYIRRRTFPWENKE